MVKQLIICMLLAGTTLGLSAQTTFPYFQDSPDDIYYEYSWMELTAPSTLERMVEPELRRFPVESDIPAQQGLNSLRLKWKSETVGNWVAIAAGTGWTAHNISETDSLVFWVQSIEGIAANLMPQVFMEDTQNKKSTFIAIGEWTGDLEAGLWTRIAIPMRLFLESADGVDYTAIKTTGFTQGEADAVEHTLLIDNVRVNVGDGGAAPVDPPARVSARGYGHHAEISWEPSVDVVSGYTVERSLDGGSSWASACLAEASDTMVLDWVKELGENLQLKYRVRSLNAAADPSSPSPVSDAQTSNLSDDELLDMVQEYTFRYFWDHAHEASGATRERNTSGNTVTSGGTGFGIMGIPVGIERGYITREEGVARMLKILGFLETADRFHGAWSHWINGNTGAAIPFSTKDNGGDIVETAYVAQGLLTIRQYFNGSDPDELAIVQKATELWEGIEWDWYRQNDSNAIYWHWSPDYNWDMNMRVKGWNEAAIVYLCAIASPTHGVPASLWDSGWASDADYVNGKIYYGHRLHLGSGYNYGGPLFFAHYSFVGFDPRDKADDYCNYFEQNRNHSLIQQAYCKSNPKGHTGYSESCWGLTASDDPDGYMAHEPNTDRDNGTITPTAALSSFPYTPDESMLALKHFYGELGEQLWGPMGFYDAFNETRDWWATSYLAIDQGPILLMIENHRSALLWDLFMANDEVQAMIEAIGFHSSPNAMQPEKTENTFRLYPNPATEHMHIQYTLASGGRVNMQIYNALGQCVQDLLQGKFQPAGTHHLELDLSTLDPGPYFTRMILDNMPMETSKFVIY